MNGTVGFVGCGNMGGALIRAAAKKLPGNRIYLNNRHPEKAEALAKETGAKAVGADELFEKSDVIFIGVKPVDTEELFGSLRPALAKKGGRTLLVSMVSGYTLDRLGTLAGTGTPIIRIMPNTPAAVGEGMIQYTPNENAAEEDIADLLFLLSEAGICDRIDERLMDAASAISGVGPAFAAMFAEALADGAVACGLSRDKAYLYAAQTLIGAGRMLAEGGTHPGEIKDGVCSPGGSTIVGVRALENGGMRAAVMNAVIASFEKTVAESV